MCVFHCPHLKKIYPRSTLAYESQISIANYLFFICFKSNWLQIFVCANDSTIALKWNIKQEHLAAPKRQQIGFSRCIYIVHHPKWWEIRLSRWRERWAKVMGLICGSPPGSQTTFKLVGTRGFQFGSEFNPLCKRTKVCFSLHTHTLTQLGEDDRYFHGTFFDIGWANICEDI